MSAVVSAGLQQAESRVTRRWRAETLEFLLVGGGTLVLLPLAWLVRNSFGLTDSEWVVSFAAFYAAMVINDPHFAVTYLLYYRDVKDRATSPRYATAQRLRYVFAGLVVPIGLAWWALSAVSTHSAESLGLMMQLMFLLVGWHYVKQGFGVLSVLSARRGARFARSERNWILAHCVSAWLFSKAYPRDPGQSFEESGVVFTSFAHPPWLDVLTGVAFAACTLGMVWSLGAKWRRDGQPPPLVPLAAMLITVWLWTVFSSLDPLLIYVIPALHSIQYLYFVWLMKRNQARAAVDAEALAGVVRRGVSSRLLKLAAAALALGWVLFHGLPTLLDEHLVLKDFADPLGPTPYLAAIVTFVNVHHYFMDSVIWRRDNPDTAFLRG